MMSEPYKVLEQLLDDIMDEMKQLGYWSSQKPDTSALESTMPFCFDSLEFEQWIQFVLLPKLSHLAKHQHRLPAKANIYPAAEEVFKRRSHDTARLLELIQQLDNLSGRLI